MTVTGGNTIEEFVGGTEFVAGLSAAWTKSIRKNVSTMNRVIAAERTFMRHEQHITIQTTKTSANAN
jgi:hypothetical protein